MDSPEPDEALITRFLAYESKRGALGPSTIGPRRIYLRKYSREVGLTNESHAVLETWLDRGLEAPSYNFWLGLLHGYYRWAIRNDVVSKDPTEMLDRLPVDDRPPVPITEEALELAIKRAGETMRCWLVLAAYAGCSPQEIAGVTRDDIVTNAHYPYLRIRKGKRGRERLVMLDERVKQAVLGLEELLQSGEPLWIIDPQACSKAINAYLQRECRIEATSSQLRHRFVKVQLEVSQDLLEAQRAIGHALPTSTLAYVPEPNVRLTAKVARHN